MLTKVGVDATPVEDDPSGDRAYVEAARRDPEAFSLIYQRYERRIYAYCLRRLGDPSLAEEAVNLVFARAYAKLASCDEHRFRAWLFAIAHNAIADGFRGARFVETPLETAFDLPDPTEGPESAAIGAEATRELATLLAKLPRDQRRVVELRLAGLTRPEIAMALGRSHDAVKKLQGRAIAKLRELIAGHPELFGRSR